MNNNKYYLLSFCIIGLLLLSQACNSPKKETIVSTGWWTGSIEMQGNTLNFGFEIQKNENTYAIRLKNGLEYLQLDDVVLQKDSIHFTFHIFDAIVNAKITENNMIGFYKKNYIDGYVLPFKAQFEEYKPRIEIAGNSSFDGKWDMSFIGENGEQSKGVGIFQQNGNQLSGTILTPVGDYRYLDGFVENSEFTLFSFDGNHAFIFKGRFNEDSVLKGDFWSGKDFHEKFEAVKNEQIELPDANKLTYLKDGYDHLEFTFPSLDGIPVSINDERFQNQVVIIQIFGTWCPNCMDETIFLNEWYKKNKTKPIQLLGLAYEAKDDFDYAKKRVETMIKKLNVEYDFLIAGTSDKKKASKTLPMLNHIMSFPTTIFIDKKGVIRKIHTGFSGPATGIYYQNFKNDFDEITEQLLNE